MKRIRIALALAIAALLLSSVALISQAEPVADEAWQADLTKLMDPGDVPSTTEINYENTYAEGAEVSTRDVACEVSVGGTTYGCEFTFDLVGEPVSDWDALREWLGGVVTEAARRAGSDSESLAKAVDVAVATERSDARSGGSGELPEWASEALKVKRIRVSTPFYPELSVGKNGEATARLQSRLIELGYLDGAADGYYGEKTAAAVEALEGYVRELEQDLIDARPASTPTPTPAPTEAPAATPEPTSPIGRHALNLVPRATAVPTEQPTAMPTMEPMPVAMDEVLLTPVTRVDGVADGLLQAYIFSDAYRPARRALGRSDSGDDVVRLQRRLRELGCTTDEPDGTYGENTVRSVRIFQHYNALSQTGEADLDTLALLFSGGAQAPANPMLTEGSSGEGVKRLQERLRELGFTTAVSDGDYGAATLSGVQAVQSYLRDREERLLHESDPTLAPDADVSDQLSTAVDGIADPMLQDELFSADFPTPAQLTSGDANDDVTRLQRRLNGLDYYYEDPDGSYGTRTFEAVTAFQKRNKLPQTGVADGTTLRLLFSAEARKAIKPYELRVSVDKQRVYAYAPDDDGNYTELVRTMKCSTGKNSTPTPKGTYKNSTGPGARWHYFKKFTCWAQYAYYIQGDIMFHSVLYNQKNGPVTRSSVNNLGSKASHGCVRLSVEDAKWIWTNCPKNTTVIVY